MAPRSKIRPRDEAVSSDESSEEPLLLKRSKIIAQPQTPKGPASKQRAVSASSSWTQLGPSGNQNAGKFTPPPSFRATDSLFQYPAPLSPSPNTVGSRRLLHVAVKSTRTSVSPTRKPISPFIGKVWAVLLRAHIFEVISETDLEELVNAETPWNYLIYGEFQKVAPENQILVMSKGLEKGFLHQSLFLTLALWPVHETNDARSYCLAQLRLGKTIYLLIGHVNWSLTSILAAMRFGPVCRPVTLVAGTEIEVTSIFEQLDKIACNLVKSESSSWNMGYLAKYYRGFLSTSDVMAAVGIPAAFIHTVAQLSSCMGGPGAWDPNQIDQEDNEFLKPIRERVRGSYDRHARR